MPGPYAATMPDPSFMMQVQQLLQSLGPYAGPAVGGLATAGALIPPIAYVANPQMRQQMNESMLADVGALGNLAGQAYNYTMPGVIGNIMEARRAQPTPMPAPAGAYKPGMNTAPQATPPPQRTPAPRGTPQPPGPSLGQRAAAAGSAIGTAANQYRQVMEQARALPMGVWQNVIAPTLRTAALPAGLVYGPKYALDPAFRADINERVGQGVVRPLANWYTGGNTPMAAGGPTPSGTPAPTGTPTPQKTPTSAPSPATTATAYPPGYQREYNGQLWVSKGNDRWEIHPLPSGQVAGR